MTFRNIVDTFEESTSSDLGQQISNMKEFKYNSRERNPLLFMQELQSP